jgi:hypothetical protein
MFTSIELKSSPTLFKRFCWLNFTLQLHNPNIDDSQHSTQ